MFIIENTKYRIGNTNIASMLLMKIILFALNVKFSRLRQGTKFR